MRMSKLFDEKVMQSYNERKSDKEIALDCDVHYKSIYRWRVARGLPSNIPQGRPRKGAKA